MMWYLGGGVHWWEWLLGALPFRMFWSLIIWPSWYLATNVICRSREQPHAAPDMARRLGERVERGEIGVERYGRRREVLRDTYARTSASGARLVESCDNR